MNTPYQSNPQTLLITINYKGADATEAFLRSAAELESSRLAHILVVENGSQDGSAERLRPFIQQFRNVELLESSNNRGYFGGANWALQHYLARGQQPKWIIVCNNDIVFDDRQFLVKLLQRSSGIAHVIAPAIIDRNTGIDSNPFLLRRPSRFRLWRCRFWSWNYYLMWFKQWLSPHVRALKSRLSLRVSIIKVDHSEIVYAPHGSFLIFSRAYFEAGGYIDDAFFLYAEELSVAETCRRLSIPVVHDPELRVIHDAHRVTGRMCNRFTFDAGRAGLEYALRTYFSPPAAPRSSRSTDSVNLLRRTARSK